MLEQDRFHRATLQLTSKVVSLLPQVLHSVLCCLSLQTCFLPEAPKVTGTQPIKTWSLSLCKAEQPNSEQYTFVIPMACAFATAVKPSEMPTPSLLLQLLWVHRSGLQFLAVSWLTAYQHEAREDD